MQEYIRIKGNINENFVYAIGLAYIWIHYWCDNSHRQHPLQLQNLSSFATFLLCHGYKMHMSTLILMRSKLFHWGASSLILDFFSERIANVGIALNEHVFFFFKVSAVPCTNKHTIYIANYLQLTYIELKHG